MQVDMTLICENKKQENIKSKCEVKYKKLYSHADKDFITKM